MSKWMGLGAKESAAAIRQGVWTPSEFLELHIESLQRIEPASRRLVSTTYGRARALTEKYDNFVPSDNLYDAYPLLGVPFVADEDFLSGTGRLWRHAQQSGQRRLRRLARRFACPQPKRGDARATRRPRARL